ncbi:MAG: exo-alpha-sialidase [Bryobacteraceae bacterium]
MARRLRTLLLLASALAPALDAQKTELLQCRMIWGRAPHNAYTDLVRFRDRFFCVFREASHASSPDGSLRVLTSLDGEVWESESQVTWPEGDLRDPRFSSAPDGRLLLSAAARAADGARQSLVWVSEGSRRWSPPQSAGESGRVLGRMAWHLGRVYVMAFSPSGPAPLRLYASADGLRFSVHSDALPVPGEPTESSLLFLSDGSAFSLLRREGAAPTAMLGRSRSPFRAWTWAELNKGIAGPNLIRLPDGRLLAAGRLIDDTIRTSLCWLDPDRETLSEFFALPSSGDTGYPGLVYHDGFLWVSYYSSHEGKARIYLAKLKLPPTGGGKTPGRLTFGN